MVDSKEMKVVRKYAQERCGYEFIAPTNIYDGDGEWWDVLVFEEAREDGKTVIHFVLVGQDSDGTIGRQAMECCMWQYLATYPEIAEGGTVLALDAATVHRITEGTYGVMYHLSAWNSIED